MVHAFKLRVGETGITREPIGLSVSRGGDALGDAINRAQRALLEDWTLARLASQRLDPAAAVAGRWRTGRVPDQTRGQGMPY